MNRRGFLKFAAGGTVGLVASPIIWNTLYDAVYWSQNWGWIPRLKGGLEEYIPTVSKLCPSGTGIKVRLAGGRPVRAIGNPDNAMSQGALTALAAAETQLLVSASRLKNPLKRSSDGAYVAISWEEAQQLLVSKMQEAGSSVACISGDPTSTINEIFSALLNAQGSSDFYFMPGDETAADLAWKAMGGHGRIGYDLENSDFILAIGANLLETWGTVGRNRRIFKKGRPAGEDATLKLAYAGPVQNNTAAGADWWLPSKAGSEMALALGIAHLLIKSGKAAFGVGLGNLEALVADCTPEKVASVTGVDPKRLAEVVEALCAAKKPLVIVGSELGAGGGAGPVMAGIAVNMLLGRLGQEGNMVALPFPNKIIPQASEFRNVIFRDLVAYSGKVAKKEVEAPKMLMLYEANPLYALPPDSGVKELLAESGFSVALSTFMSETCMAADLVLPAAMGLERFDDVYTPYGSGAVNYSISQPVVKPYYQARCMGDLMLALGKSLGLDLGVEDMPHLLNKKASQVGANFREMMDTGAAYIHPEIKGTLLPYYNVEALQASMPTPPAQGQLTLAPVTVLGMGTAQTAIPPFATKIITDYQLKGPYSVAQMNGATAEKLGVKKGDRLKLNNDNAEIFALVDIFEGVQPDSVAMCTGLGHSAYDEFSQNKGANIMTLTSVSYEAGTGLALWGKAAVSAVKA